MRVLIVDSDQELLEILQSFMSMWARSGGRHKWARVLDILFAKSPEVLVLEEELLWGGCENILALMSEDPVLNQIPTILIATTIHTVHCRSLCVSRFSVATQAVPPWATQRLHRCRRSIG